MSYRDRLFYTATTMRGFAWKKTPALPGAIACAAGIWLSEKAGALSPLSAFVVAAVTLGVGITLCTRQRRPPAFAPALCAILLVIATGFTRYQHAVFAGENAWEPLVAEHVERRFRGRVVSVRGRPDWLRVELTAITVGDRTRLPGRLMLFVRQDADATLSEPVEVGSFLTMRAKLEHVPRVRNPSDFDYGRWLRRHGVRAVTTVTAREIAVASQARRFPRTLASGARKHVRKVLDTHVSAQSRPVIQALLLGDRTAIEGSIRDNFVNTGLVHVLAVSGLHVMIVGFACHALLGPFLRRFGLQWRAAEGVRTAATLTVLSSYVVLAGVPMSAVRAATMTAFLLAGPIFRRSAQSLNSLFAAAWMIMIVWPGSLFDAGFQLSVSAVTGILVLVPRWSGSITGRIARRWLGTFVTGNVLVTTAATISTAPVLLAHFGRMSAAGLVLNIPAIPLTTASLASAVLAVAASPIPFLARSFGAMADACARILIDVAAIGSEWFRHATIIIAPHAATLLGLFVVVLGIFAARRRGAHWRYLALGLTLLTLSSLVDVCQRLLLGRCDLLILDVGQGDAALLTGPTRRTILIDTGPPPFRDALRHTVIAHLTRHNLDVDLLVLTHAHADHIGATRDLLRNVHIHRIATSGPSLSSPSMEQVYDLADRLGVPMRAVVIGDTLMLEPSIAVQVLAPSLTATDAFENNRSVVLRVRCGPTRVLFLGDAEAASEAAMVTRFGDHLQADIVKVGHHGSRTSSTPYFVNHVIDGNDENVAVISVARRNRYGLPDEEVLERWRAAGYNTLLTSDNGAVRVRMDRNGYEINRWR